MSDLELVFFILGYVLAFLLAMFLAFFVVKYIKLHKILLERGAIDEDDNEIENKAEEAKPVKEEAVIEPVAAPVEEAAPSKKEWNIQKTSFAEKLAASKKELEKQYNEIKAEALAYGLKSRISFSGDTFRLHKKTYLKIVISGKNLKVLYALKAKDYKDSPIPLIDLSDKASKAETPSALWVKSDLALKRAKTLVDDVCTKDGLKKGEVKAVLPVSKPAPKAKKPAPKAVAAEPGKEATKFNIKKTSFEDKLKKADRYVKGVYQEIKEYALSKGVKGRISFSGETFRLHKKTYLKIAISGKSLKVFFALDPKNYVNSSIPLIDLSEKPSKADTPSALWIKSDLAIKRAKTLIDDVCKDIAE